ncbi:RNA polymerase III-inhibiting protein maf1 [Agyrium rufum]|nr:RNA polymerase III-inhibiting protein maf1 [Agyrium rufum]
MKYLLIRDFDDVTNALNFDTADCHVTGGCDIYTTKAASADKKLYKNIESSLESQYESLLRFSASLPAEQAAAAAPSLNLSRSSPFGPLSQISSRRTFAYLVATLNASHSDYDFSNVLRPTDFRRERYLKGVMNTLDTTLYNLRPRPSAGGGQLHWSSAITQSGPPTPGGGHPWGSRMWRTIDQEMTLRECSIYSFAPEEDIYEGEESALWSYDFFFFNKARKRVCYIYLRGMSIISHSPAMMQNAPESPYKRRARALTGESESEFAGASKRARYWLGDRAEKADREWGEDYDESELMDTLNVEETKASKRVPYDGEEKLGSEHSSPPLSPSPERSRSKSTVRGISEDIVENMEI